MSSILQPAAYIKIILHSAKYPSSPVGGYILGDIKASGEFVVNDVVPVCHRNPCGPMLEICAEMVERLYGPKMKIIGYYYVNENMKSTRSAYISQLVSGIKQNTSGPCLLLEVQQDLLSKTDVLALKATSNEEEVDVKLTNNVNKVNTVLDGLLEKGEYRQLVDFEDHMDTASTAEVCAKEKVFDFRNSFVGAAASGL